MVINSLIQLIDNENVKVTRKETYTKPSGAQGFTVNEIGTFIMSIQETGSLNKVAGLTLKDNLKGNDVTSVYVGYCDDVSIEVGDIINRFQRDGLDYVIKNKEANGHGTILKHTKYYMVRVDNQK